MERYRVAVLGALERYPFLGAFASLCLVGMAATLCYQLPRVLAEFQPYHEAATIGVGAKSFDELSDRFKALAESKGGAYAFDVLKRAVLPSNTDLHLLGHDVGDILYEQKGIAGMSYCTPDFRNACSHTIVIGALGEFGESALPMIRDACAEAPGGPGAYTMCYHGLGHGVFAYYGYDFTKTVELCKKTGTPEYQDREYIECVGGAVMELMGGGGHDRDKWLAARERYLTDKPPLSPCVDSVIPREAKEMCLMYLTPRLFEAAGAYLELPTPDTFPKAFGYCDTLTAPDLRRGCFGGFGKEFVPLVALRDIRTVDTLDEDQLRTVAGWCSFASAGDGEGYCIAEALSSLFWGGENNPDASFRLCAVTSGAGAAACYKRLAESIVQYMPEPLRREALCTRLPEGYQAICQTQP